MSAPHPSALIVEDEPQIRRFVRMAFEQEGWRVHEAADYARGLSDAATRQPDLLVLDLGLPGGDGVALIRELRAWSQLPVIVLSARTDERDKVRALDAGADDYLTKPFGVDELMARVRATMRRVARPSGAPGTRVAFGDVSVDLAARSVHKAGVALHLTRIEWRLLAHLVAHSGRLLTHRQLLTEVWGPTHVGDTHYLRVHMGHLRKKLEDDPAQPRHLVTESGVGYRLVE